MPTLSSSVLDEFAVSLLTGGGASEEGAKVVAASLVQSNLRGHDSHGVMRIPFYVGRIQEGVLQPESTLTIENEAPSSLVCDGGWGFGQVLCRDLTNRLIEKSEQTGIACGTLRRASHCGRLGEYAEMATEKGKIALISANTHGAAQRVAPVGGKRPRLGTNPICIGIAGGENGPFILDFGTSATAEGKVRVKRIAGEKVPAGWILDPDGRPTTDPNQLYGDPPGTILPMGGDQAYKGFGLSYMIEMLCGGLSGGECVHPNPSPPIGNCIMMVVFSPEKFAGSAHLANEVKNLETYVRDVPLIDGIDHVTLPGDPERATLQDRTQNGIPLDDGNWSALTDLANELGVSTPNV